MATTVERTAVPSAITTPSAVDAPMGSLEFTDGYPTGETAEKLRDHLDYLHGVETFMNTIQGVSTYALREGFRNAGIADGTAVLSTVVAMAHRLPTLNFGETLSAGDHPGVAHSG